MATDNPLEDLVEPVDLTLIKPRNRPIRWSRIPISTSPLSGSLEPHDVAWRNAANGLEHGLVQGGAAMAQMVGEHRPAHRGRYVRMLDQGFDRGGQQDVAPGLRVEQRIDAEGVPRSQQEIVPAVP